jgi:hypothetical protein
MSFFQQLQDSKKFIFPILLTILLTAILTVIVKGVYYPNPDDIPQNIAPYNGTTDIVNDPIGTAATGLGNALIYILIALIGGFILVFLIRIGKIKALELLFASMMAFATFVFGSWIFPAVMYSFFVSFPVALEIFSVRLAEILIFEGMVVFSLLLGVISFLVLGINRFRSQKAHNTFMVLFGAMMGVVFGIFFPTTILFFVLLGLAVYDIYAVFWGPIKQMFNTPSIGNESNNEYQHGNDIQSKSDIFYQESIREEIEQLSEKPRPNSILTMNSETLPASGQERNLAQNLPISLPVYFTPEISIGLGDFVFFSVLVAKSIFDGLNSNNYWLFILPFLGILVGAFITFRLLEKREILPALPIPIIVGTFGFILALVLDYMPQLL